MRKICKFLSALFFALSVLALILCPLRHVSFPLLFLIGVLFYVLHKKVAEK